MLVNTKEMYKNAMLKKYAIGGFDATNHFLTECIIEAAENKNTPILLMIPVFAFGNKNDEEFIRYIVQRCEYSKIPIALHLDHAENYKQCIYAISKGFTSVMIDGSSLSIEDNIALTKTVVKIAHACNVTVEAEIGHVAGDESKFGGSVADESLFTKTSDAIRFVDKTKVDSLAVAFGTVHGVFKGTPNLDFNRLDDLRENIDIPLVMHGGSGLSNDDFIKVVKHGINKINIFSEISLATSKLLYENLQKVNGDIHIKNVLDDVHNEIVPKIENYIDLFNHEINL